MVVESLPLGGDGAETFPMDQGEIESVAKNFDLEEPEIPSAKLVSWPLLSKFLQVPYFTGSIPYCPVFVSIAHCRFPFKC